MGRFRPLIITGSVIFSISVCFEVHNPESNVGSEDPPRYWSFNEKTLQEYLLSVGRWKPSIESPVGNEVFFAGDQAFLDIGAPEKQYFASYTTDLGSVVLKTFKSIHYRTRSKGTESATFGCSIGFQDHPFLERIYLDCHLTSENCASEDQSFECYYADRFRLYDPESASNTPRKIQYDGYELVNQGLQSRKVSQNAYLRSGPGIEYKPIVPIVCPAESDRCPKGYPFIVLGRTIEKSRVLGKKDYWYYGFAHEYDCDLPSQRKAWIFGALIEP